jgi:hypothetical protein
MTSTNQPTTVNWLRREELQQNAVSVVREHTSVGRPDCNLGFDPHCEMAIDVVFGLLHIPNPFRRACAAAIVAPIPKANYSSDSGLTRGLGMERR